MKCGNNKPYYMYLFNHFETSAPTGAWIETYKS